MWKVFSETLHPYVSFYLIFFSEKRLKTFCFYRNNLGTSFSTHRHFAWVPGPGRHRKRAVLVGHRSETPQRTCQSTCWKKAISSIAEGEVIFSRH